MTGICGWVFSLEFTTEGFAFMLNEYDEALIVLTACTTAEFELRQQKMFASQMCGARVKPLDSFVLIPEESDGK